MLKSIQQVKRLIIAVIGFSVLAIGMAMIVLPGPAFIVIPLGLFILTIVTSVVVGGVCIPRWFPGGS